MLERNVKIKLYCCFLPLVAFYTQVLIFRIPWNQEENHLHEVLYNRNFSAVKILDCKIIHAKHTFLKTLNLERTAPRDRVEYYVTSEPENFDRVANIFLGEGSNAKAILKDIKD